MEYKCGNYTTLVRKTKFREPELHLRKKLKLHCGDINRKFVLKYFNRLRLCARKIDPWEKNSKSSETKVIRKSVSKDSFCQVRQ